MASERSGVGRVWVDKPPGNEDPFVLRLFMGLLVLPCDATQAGASRIWLRDQGLVHFVLQWQPRRQETSVGHRHRVLGSVLPTSGEHQASLQTTTRKRSAGHTDLWKSHLRFGGQPGGHKGRYTYEAALFPQPDSRYSRLPLDADGDRIRISLSLLSRELREQISETLHGKYPALLSDGNLRELLALERERTSIEVVRDIVAEDHDFIALREEQIAGCCAPCQKEC